MSGNGEIYPDGPMNTTVIDMDSSTIILKGGDEVQNVEVGLILQNQAWTSQTFPTITVPALDQLLSAQGEGVDPSASMIAGIPLDQQLLSAQGEGVDPSASMIAGIPLDQQLLSAQGEGVDPSASMIAGIPLDQQPSAQGEGGVQPSFQTSRNEAIPGTSSGRMGRKRNSKGEYERKKKLPKYMWDHNDPRLTPEERDSVKNSKNAKRNRDKKNEEMHKLQQNCDNLKNENESLKMENKELLAKLKAQYQELEQYQTRFTMMGKLATSPLDSSMFQ